MRRRILLLRAGILGSAGATAAAAAASAATPSAATLRRRTAAPPPAPPTAAGPRRLRLRHAATGASFAGPYHNGRAPDPRAMAELSQVLADHRAGAMRPFDPRALDILWELARREGVGEAEEFLIFSGYRTPVTNMLVGGAGDSQHMQAKALDVHLAAARLTAFGEAALALARGGVGIYPAQGFVHIDSGPVRHWTATAGATTAAQQRARPPVDRIGRIAEAWSAMRR